MKPQLAIKVLIWAYLVLLIFEGSLRKWIVPGLSGPLLIIRDPVVVAIYMAAASNRVFPQNGAMVVLGVLSAVSAIFAMVFGHGNLGVMLFGLHVNYLHVPLIWIMGSVLTRRDLLWIGIFLMVIAIPNTTLMVEQYNAPFDAKINWGAGGEGTEQLSGTDGHIRPPGFFTFITGPAAFYPIVAAFIIYALLGKMQLVRIVAIGAAIATALAIPVSISRSVMLGVGIVGVTGAICAVISGKIAGNVIKIGVLVAVLAIIVPSIGVFDEALGTFTKRWDDSTSDVKTDIGGRWALGFLEVFDFLDSAPFFGFGIGMGTNAALGLTSGQRGYSPAESEWGRIAGELGPVVGVIYLGFRCWLTWSLWVAAWRAWRKYADSLALLILSAVGLNVINGQWGPPTQLGFAIFGAGLVLAAAKSAEETEVLPGAVDVPAPTVETRRRIPTQLGERPPSVLKPLRR